VSREELNGKGFIVISKEQRIVVSMPTLSPGIHTAENPSKFLRRHASSWCEFPTPLQYEDQGWLLW